MKGHRRKPDCPNHGPQSRAAFNPEHSEQQQDSESGFCAGSGGQQSRFSLLTHLIQSARERGGLVISESTQIQRGLNTFL